MFHIEFMCFGLAPVVHYHHQSETKYTRFEAFTAVMVQVEVFWVVILCSVVVGYHCFSTLKLNVILHSCQNWS